MFLKIWQNNSSFLKETLMAYSFSVLSIVAGFTIALNSPVFTATSWSVAMYPAILSSRGIICGLLSGRLSTALHLGTIFPRVFNYSREFKILINIIFTITFEISLIVSFFLSFSGVILWRLTIYDVMPIFLVFFSTMAFSLFLILVTLVVSIISFKYGLNPDVFLYPVVSALSDVIVTFFYILVLRAFFSGSFYNLLLIFLPSIILLLLAINSVRQYSQEKDFRKTIKESIIPLFFVTLIVNVSGVFLNNITKIIGSGRNVLLLVYPALMAIVGDVSAVVGSTATTKLSLGLVKPHFSTIKEHLSEIFFSWFASAIMFLLFILLSFFLPGTFAFSYSKFIFLLITTNVFSVLIIIFISYYLAIASFKRGLNPDNLIIPIMSSLSDNITSFVLLTTLLIVGW